MRTCDSVTIINNIDDVIITEHCVAFANTLIHSMFIVEVHVNVNYVKILSVVQQRQIYVADNNTTYVGLCVMRPAMHCNKNMFDCLWPSLEVKFG